MNQITAELNRLTSAEICIRYARAYKALHGKVIKIVSRNGWFITSTPTFSKHWRKSEVLLAIYALENLKRMAFKSN